MSKEKSNDNNSSLVFTVSCNFVDDVQASAQSLAESALDESRQSASTIETDLRIRIGSYGAVVRRPLGNVDDNGSQLYQPPMKGTFTVFPLSQADQSHALSIAEMIARGISDVGKIHDSDYDFADGEDTGLETSALAAWKDPAELAEAEQALNDRLVSGITEARRRDDVDKPVDKSNLSPDAPEAPVEASES